MTNEVEEKLAFLEKRLDTLERVLTKALTLVKGQNEIVQKLADAVAAILKKMAGDVNAASNTTE